MEELSKKIGLGLHLVKYTDRLPRSVKSRQSARVETSLHSIKPKEILEHGTSSYSRAS